MNKKEYIEDIKIRINQNKKTLVEIKKDYKFVVERIAKLNSVFYSGSIITSFFAIAFLITQFKLGIIILMCFWLCFVLIGLFQQENLYKFKLKIIKDEFNCSAQIEVGERLIKIFNKKKNGKKK